MYLLWKYTFEHLVTILYGTCIWALIQLQITSSVQHVGSTMVLRSALLPHPRSAPRCLSLWTGSLGTEGLSLRHRLPARSMEASSHLLQCRPPARGSPRVSAVAHMAGPLNSFGSTSSASLRIFKSFLAVAKLPWVLAVFLVKSLCSILDKFKFEQTLI